MADRLKSEASLGFRRASGGAADTTLVWDPVDGTGGQFSARNARRNVWCWLPSRLLVNMFTVVTSVWKVMRLTSETIQYDSGHHMWPTLLTSFLWLFELASGLSSRLYFCSIVHNHFIHLLHGLLMYTVSENKPPSKYYGWLPQALKITSLSSQYQFITYTLSSLYISFIPSSCKAIIIITIIRHKFAIRPGNSVN